MHIPFNIVSSAPSWHTVFQYFLSFDLQIEMKSSYVWTDYTYRHDLQVVALERLQQIGHASFQSSIDEDAITEVVQQNGPQSIQIAYQRHMRQP